MPSKLIPQQVRFVQKAREQYHRLVSVCNKILLKKTRSTRALKSHGIAVRYI